MTPMDNADEGPPIEMVDPELRELFGMFDVPAFARRGQDLEYARKRLDARLDRQRDEMLEMVRLRLRQWAAGVEGPDAWRGTFAGPLDALWAAAGAPSPRWGGGLAPRRRRSLAHDLIGSVERFNRRWTALLEGLPLDPLNTMIEQYNRYYLLEKECVLRSSRLAARHFRPYARVTAQELAYQYPSLPMPCLAP